MMVSAMISGRYCVQPLRNNGGRVQIRRRAQRGVVGWRMKLRNTLPFDVASGIGIGISGIRSPLISSRVYRIASVGDAFSHLEDFPCLKILVDCPLGALGLRPGAVWQADERALVMLVRSSLPSR